MAAKQIMLTAEDVKKYEEELEFLKTEKRKEIAEKIKVARSYGDLSENSEYDDAKNEQAMLEARIATVEVTLKNAVIIDESNISNEHVHLTSVVKVEYVSNGRQVSFKILGSGSNGINPREGVISDESPIAKAAIKKKVRDIYTLEAPEGELKFDVLEISK